MKSEKFKTEDIGKLEIFNSQYKIKFKGLMMKDIDSCLYIFESHKKLVGIEVIPCVNYSILHYDLKSYFDVPSFCGYKYEKELIIENNKNFKNNILILSPSMFEFQYIMLNQEIENEIYDEKKGCQLSMEEFKEYLFGKQENLDDLIKGYSIPKEINDTEKGNELSK